MAFHFDIKFRRDTTDLIYGRMWLNDSLRILFKKTMPRLVAISDTHSRHEDIPALPPGDILVHAGDATRRGDISEVSALNAWLGTLDFKYKILIAGNHDWLFARSPALARSLITNALYLEDESAEIEGLKFYGTPWQPRFFNWAFNLDRGQPMREKWSRIPNDTDILISHGPPHGILDQVDPKWSGRSESAGCQDLLERVSVLKPRVHIFGHIHSGYGQLQQAGTLFVNASICDEQYSPVNLPIVIDI